jgi:hypothetical protein
MKLDKNAYSPATLAKALDYIVSDKTIRREIEKGSLKTMPWGPRRYVIPNRDAREWLENLPSAKAPLKRKAKNRRRVGKRPP